MSKQLSLRFHHPEPPKTLIAARIAPAHADALRAYVESKGMTMTWAIETAVRDFLRDRRVEQ